MSIKSRFLNWEEIDSVWENIKRDDEFMLWEDIRLIEEVKEVFRKLKGGGGGFLVPGSAERDIIARREMRKALEEELGKEKTKKFIKIYCRINGIEYTEEKLVNDDIEMTVYNFERVFKESEKSVKVRKDSIK